jgi:plastocyanin
MILSRIKFIILITIFVLFSIIQSFAQEKKGEKQYGITGKELVNKVVTITTFEGLDPAEVNSGRGTTVVWVNHSVNDMRILFKEGDQITVSCINPVNFSLQKDGTFQSDIIPHGGTASICFLEQGTYKYQLFKVAGPTSRDPSKLGSFKQYGVINIR